MSGGSPREINHDFNDNQVKLAAIATETSEKDQKESTLKKSV